MEHARPPAELSLEGGPSMRSEAWRQWRKLFQVFLKASGVIKEPKEIQASLLVNLIGSAGYDVYTTFKFQEGESEDDIACVLNKFDTYFGTKRNIIVRRYKFFTRTQEESENIDQYVTALRLLSDHCEFGDLHESLIRDRIVCGIVNNTVRDRLLRTEELTLTKAIQICQAAEISKEESVCIDGKPGATGDTVDAVSSSGRGAGGGRGRRGRHGGGWRGARRGAPTGAAAQRTSCTTCGGTSCTGGDRCPAHNALCFVCDKKGHFSRVCYKKKMMQKVLNVSVHSAESDSDSDMFSVDTLSGINNLSKSSKEWIEIIKCNSKKLAIKIDTGSMINVISKNDFLRIGFNIEQLQPFTKRVHSFTGNRLAIIGTIDLNISYLNTKFTLPFAIADFHCQNILGLEGCIRIGVIKSVNSININKYSSLFEGLGKLPGKYTIVFDKNIQPVISPTRKIPLGLKEKLLKELKRMESLGVVRKVTHPTDWVNAIVLVAKKNGSIRVCLDPRPLNKAVRRAQYTLPTVTELAVKLRGACVFSVLDARCGFWMIEIDDASADLCTFSTPFGRYQFLRLPYGISCAPEIFHARLRQYLEDLEGVESFIDDVIVWGRSREEHDRRLEALLQRAGNIGVKFNRDKCKFGVSEITYLGHKFDVNGMRADESKVKAILNMPYPTDRKSLERFLGMINYLSKFIQNYSDCVNVLRGLLKKDAEWSWDVHHAEAVNKLKAKISSAPVLALYSTELPVVLSVDASSVAVGAVILQSDRPVEFASLTLTETQTRYAQIEKEMMAIVFAVERFRQYIYGRSDVTVHTDHKPLEALFHKPLASVPSRLQRMMMRVQGFDVKVVYTPGKYMYIADTLSRAPLNEMMDDKVTEEVEIQTCFMLENISFSEEKIQLLKEEINRDRDCMFLIEMIQNGWPRRRDDVCDRMKVFWSYRQELHCIDGLILKGERVFIPKNLRSDMISRVHEGHLGIERCKRRARDVMFWPGMVDDVETAVRQCEACALHAPRPKRQPLVQYSVPDLPWHKLASDIFEYRKKRYIILVDYFSNYVEVSELTGMSSKNVINFMKAQFARYGIPTELVTDNGPAYSSNEFKKFMREWEVNHITSSPHYPQSNGKSERTVQTVKNLLKKCIDSGQDFYLSLLNFRSTPRNNIDSPAQMLMGRRIKTKLPISKVLLTEPVDNVRNYEALMAQKKLTKQNYDRSARSLQDLSIGDRVTLISNGNRKFVTIVERMSDPRSFIVEDDQGNRYRRTRNHLISRVSKSNKSEITLSRTTNTRISQTFTNSKPLTLSSVRRRRTKIVTNNETGQMNNSLLQEMGATSPEVSVTSQEESVILQQVSVLVPEVSNPTPTPSPLPEAASQQNTSDSSYVSDEGKSPSPPKVQIERSKERTTRMLSNLIFGKTKD